MQSDKLLKFLNNIEKILKLKFDLGYIYYEERITKEKRKIMIQDIYIIDNTLRAY